MAAVEYYVEMLAARKFGIQNFFPKELGTGAEPANPPPIIGRRDVRSGQCTYFAQFSQLSNGMFS